MTASSDRTWFITGASSGIGKSLALAVLARGERVDNVKNLSHFRI